MACKCCHRGAINFAGIVVIQVDGVEVACRRCDRSVRRRPRRHARCACVGGDPWAAAWHASRDHRLPSANREQVQRALYLHSEGGGGALNPPDPVLMPGAVITPNKSNWPTGWIQVFGDAARTTLLELVQITVVRGTIWYKFDHADGIAIPIEVYASGSGDDCGKRTGCYVPRAQVLSDCPDGLLVGTKCVAPGVYCAIAANAGRDRVLRTNQCDATTKPFGNFPLCVQYQGCLPGYPVVHCEYPGLGHSPASAEGASIAQFFGQF